MKLKNIFAIFIVLLLSSCTDYFLDLDDPSSVTEDSYFNTEAQFREGVNDIYTNVKNWRSGDLGNDIFDYGSDLSTTPVAQADYANGNITIPTSDTEWSKTYIYIRAANKILEYAKDYSDQDEIAQEIAEAYFFRAWFHFALLQYFGGVPIVTSVLETDSEELYSARNSRYEVTEQILSDLELAMDDLPLEANIETAYKGLISQQACKAFKARVLLHEATWMRYVGTDTDGDGVEDGAGSEGYDVSNIDIYLAEAAELCAEVMEDATYELWDYNASLDDNMSNFFLFNLSEDATSNPLEIGKASNKEFIMYRVHDVDLFHDSNPAQTGRNAPSRKMIDMVLCSDGLPIEKTTTAFQGYTNAGDEYDYRDYRLKGYFSSYYNFGDYTDLTSGVQSNETVSLSGYSDADSGGGYKCHKYKRWGYGEDGDLSNQGSLNYPHIRLAEVYLTYAEALYELNGTLTDDQLDASINKTRARAGIPGLSNSFITTYTLDLQEEIRREWAVEFYAENSRFHCLKRWGIAVEELSEPVCGMVVEDTPFEFDESIYAVSVYPNDVLEIDLPNGQSLEAIQTATTDDRGFMQKHYLHPLPTDEIDLNENLLQNPGY